MIFSCNICMICIYLHFCGDCIIPCAPTLQYFYFCCDLIMLPWSSYAEVHLLYMRPVSCLKQNLEETSTRRGHLPRVISLSSLTLMDVGQHVYDQPETHLTEWIALCEASVDMYSSIYVPICSRKHIDMKAFIFSRHWDGALNSNLLSSKNQLSHLPLDKMAAISQTTFSNAFSWT